MASRLASRLKPGSSNKKSPVPSQPGTPTHSQTSVSATGKQEDPPSIDDVLTGPDIESLRVDVDELKKIHDSTYQSACSGGGNSNNAAAGAVSSDRKRTQQVVVIRDSENLQLKKRKCVAVLYPLPAGIKPTKTKLLGSVEAGPRHDKDEMFVNHSILGPVEEFMEAEKSNVTPFNVSRVPTTVFPKTPPTKKSSTRKHLLSREANALMNWENRMKERKQLQDNIQRRLNTSNQLVMNHGDTYRQTQEQRTVIDRAIPPYDIGKGYHVGSEFWKLQPRIGSEDTGLRLTLTNTERGHPPDIEMVGLPRSTRKTQGLKSAVSEPFCHSWKKSAYLKSRKNELKDVISELSFGPSKELAPVHVTRISSGYHGNLDNRPHTTSTTAFLNSGSLNSLDEGADNDENSLLQSTSVLDIHPDVTSVPIVGPALKLNNHLLKWEGKSSPSHSISAGTKLRPPSDTAAVHDTAAINTRVLLETVVGQSVSSLVHLHNVGTTSLKYNWKRVDRPNPLGTSLAGKTQRFYFNTKADILSPGQSLSQLFVFKSSSPGTYRETWRLETSPVLCSHTPIILTLKGTAFKPDSNKSKREKIEELLNKQVAEVISKRLINTIVDSVRTPPRVVTPLPLKETEKQEFLRKNSIFHVFYHHDHVVTLKNLYIETKCPSLAPAKPPPSEPVAPSTKGGAGAAAKKEEKAKKGGKEKKDGGAGKAGGGGKGATAPTAQPVVAAHSSNHDVVREQQGDQISLADIPPWDLSINTLQQMILEVDDDDRREDLFSRLNTAISSLCLPPVDSMETTKYNIMYSILCETIDDISEYSTNLRGVLGLPPRDLGLKSEEDSTEADTIQPTHSESPIHGGKKDQAAGKKGRGKAERDLVKEKDRPGSKQKGKIQRKGSFKTAAKNVIVNSKSQTSPEPEKPVVEVDPVTEQKYKQNFQSMVHFILSEAMQQADNLMDLTNKECNI